MNGVFSSGQNAPLTAHTVRFTASAAAPIDLCAFVVDDRLQVASSDDVVFYNQPRTQGVRLDGDTIVVELGALRAGTRVLCAVGTDSAVAVSSSLTDPSGAPLAAFDVEPSGTETALLCWEIYPHNGNWKVRALGQGYAGGLGAMFTAHGVEVDDEPAPVEQQPAGIPSDLAPSFEWLWKIFEDAARSATAYLSAHEYAQHRLDDELSAAVADPATRTGVAAEAARARAHRRCEELNSAAEQRHRDDSARLTDELNTIDSRLPASLSTWTSTSWNTLRTPSDGIRVGELSAPERGTLQVPLCVPLPMHRPLWIDAGDSEIQQDSATQQVVTALALRLLAARPGARVDIVDPARALVELRELAAPVLAGPPVLDIGGVAAKLKGLADSADLTTLAMSTDPAAAHLEPRVLVLVGVPHGYSSDDLVQVVRLTRLPGAQHISILIAGSTDTVVDDPAHQILLEQSQHLPSSTEGRFSDPWTGNDWTFTPDVIPADAVLLQRVITTLGAT